MFFGRLWPRTSCTGGYIEPLFPIGCFAAMLMVGTCRLAISGPIAKRSERRAAFPLSRCSRISSDSAVVLAVEVTKQLARGVRSFWESLFK